MKLNLTKPLVVFDLETTGLDIVKDRIIQISYIKIFPDGKEERANLLLNPTKPARLSETFHGCDFAGFNSNHFDVPVLAEEFLRAGIDFDFSKCRLIDAQTIYHKMERRNLAAAYKFYCGRKMEEDFQAHRADQDTEATYRVLMGELEHYAPGSPATLEEPDHVLENDMDELAKFSKINDNVDFAGRIVWKPMTDAKGQPLLDAEGKPRLHEVFNFGKYKGWSVLDALHRDPGYYSWMMQGDFPQNTKQVLTRIRMKDFNSK